MSVLDACDVNHAVRASVEIDSPNEAPFVRLRPHMPTAYYSAQQHSVVLSLDAVKNLVSLLERAGVWKWPMDG